MLSPGRLHEKVPRTLRTNLLWRKKLLAECVGSPALRRQVKAYCATDCLFYVNTFCYQYNPTLPPEERVGPFVTWPFQDKALRSILDSVQCHCRGEVRPHQHDLVIEKSREMGASWLCLLALDWMFLYVPWSQFLCVSKSEKAVESEKPDSLFWKLDFVHKYLPDWLKPKIKRRDIYFGNEDNGSVIAGEASTGRAGVGGRATAMLVDEFAQIKEDSEVMNRTSDTTGCRIFNSTHLGTGTEFYELCQRRDVKKLVMHWTQHPEKSRGIYRYDRDKNRIEVLDKTYRYPEHFDFVYSEAPTGGPCPGVRSPWYDEQCGRKTNTRAVAMDLDIDPGGSVAQVFNPLTIKALIAEYACKPYWEGDLAYDGDTGRPEELRKREGGPIRLWVHLKDGLPVRSKYVAGADISAGHGRTNSCLSIADSRTGEKVCEVAVATMLPHDFAPLCTALCWLFQDEDGEPAYFAWEHAGPGATFGKVVVELGYRAIYYRRGSLTLAGGKVSENPGWVPQNDQKRILIEDYRSALERRQFVNRCEEALKECVHFRYNAQGNVEHSQEADDPDPTGARVNHGDRTIADALASKLMRGKMVKAQKRAQEEVQKGTLAWRRLLASRATEYEEAY